VTNEPRIVQFPHPGTEHVPKSDEMGWNDGYHRRKFLLTNGTTVNQKGETTYKGLLTFWGEWEAPSTIKERWPRREQFPTVLHEPYWVDCEPIPNQQNTDPWVFGPRFLYSNCKQLTPSGRPSALQSLTPGSMIMFGSTFHGDFMLDTVFVVGVALTKFRPVDGIEIESAAFQTCTIRSLAALEPRKSSASLTLFAGATPERPSNGMFSFTPARRADNANYRFQRPRLAITGVINPMSWQSPRGAKVATTPEEVRATWHATVKQVESQGLELGTDLRTPGQRMTDSSLLTISLNEVTP
jgi:hypothetical protein